MYRTLIIIYAELIESKLLRLHKNSKKPNIASIYSLDPNPNVYPTAFYPFVYIRPISLRRYSNAKTENTKHTISFDRTRLRIYSKSVENRRDALIFQRSTVYRYMKPQYTAARNVMCVWTLVILPNVPPQLRFKKKMKKLLDVDEDGDDDSTYAAYTCSHLEMTVILNLRFIDVPIRCYLRHTYRTYNHWESGGWVNAYLLPDIYV